MSRGDVRPGRGPLRGTIVLLVLVLAAGAATSLRYGWLDRLLDGDAAPPADPARVAPPEGVSAPDVVVPRAVAAPTDVRHPARLDPAAVRKALRPYLHDPDVGQNVRAVVAPLDGGPPVFERGHGDAIPASTTKLVTSAAALLALGPSHVFTTSVARTASHRIVLVGGGDPFLAAKPDGGTDPDAHPAVADVTTLARETAHALHVDGVRSVAVDYDTSLFSGPAVNPRWESDYVPEVVSPIESLWVDQGRDTQGEDPAAAAAQVFAKALARHGVTVRGTPTEGTATDRATELAHVDSAPLDEIVEKTLEVSDNEAAEVLLRHVGLATEGTGSFVAGRRGVVSLLAEHGVDLGHSALYDGSGLSRDDRLDPAVLVAVLRLAASARHPDLRAVVTGLPVAGFTGSLADRMEHGEPAGLGRVRAKTGTLSHVQDLAGLATDLEGTTFVFVIMLDRIRLTNTLDAREALDDAAAALGACHCSTTG